MGARVGAGYGVGEELAKAVAGIRQGSGVVGKLCTVGIFAFLALGTGLYAMPGEAAKMHVMLWAVGFVCGTLLLFVAMCLVYAHLNPQQASMESADLRALLMKQAEIAGTNQPAMLPPPEANVAPPQIAGSATSKPEEKRDA
jgi:hypothetical protein